MTMINKRTQSAIGTFLIILVACFMGNTTANRLFNPRSEQIHNVIVLPPMDEESLLRVVKELPNVPIVIPLEQEK